MMLEFLETPRSVVHAPALAKFPPPRYPRVLQARRD